MRTPMILLLTALLALSTDAGAADAFVSGAFQQKEKSIRGAWHIERRGEDAVLVFADDFRAARGPDLKVFLSPRDIASVSGDTATDGALLLGELERTRGRQEYLIPPGTDLSAFESVLVHCERYAVLWGGGAL